jgi:hypothetical protein
MAVPETELYVPVRYGGTSTVTVSARALAMKQLVSAHKAMTFL